MKDEYMIYKLSDSIKSTSHIDNELFVKHNVKEVYVMKIIPVYS